jgi:hypothetical protein
MRRAEVEVRDFPPFAKSAKDGVFRIDERKK